MPHLTCRDQNIIGLKSKLIAAYIEGIRNLLLVTGDPVASSDRNEIESVFNLNSYKLMELVQEMNQDKLNIDPYFFGGALNLNTINQKKELERMYRKIKSGASFFLTQPIFDKTVIEFIQQLDKPDSVKILGGIMPLVSYKNAQFLDNEIPGISIPDDIINKFNVNMSKKEGEKQGIKIAIDIVDKIKDNIDGLYFMTPFNRAYIIKNILDNIN
jgi:homocysteine S-methyltransferase